MTRIDFDAEIATLAAEPLVFALFGRDWHSVPAMTLREKRLLTRRLTAAQNAQDPDEGIDAVLDMLGLLVIPAEKDDFMVAFEEHGDEATAIRVMERLMEAHAGRPTQPPNGSKAPSGRTSGRSTGTALPAG